MKLYLSKIEEPFRMELTNDRGNKVILDASSAIGGSGYEFRPMELLAGSLAACMTIDVLNILKKKRLRTDQFHVTVEAKRADAVPSPFEHIHLIVSVDRTIDLDQLKKSVDLVLKKYCSVSASLNDTIVISSEIKHVEQ